MNIGPFKDLFTIRQCINLHKLLVIPVYIAILTFFLGEEEASAPFEERSYATLATLLLTFHGLYGVFWVIKDVWYPDLNWMAGMSPLSFVVVSTWPLGIYYLPMYCLVSRTCPGPRLDNNGSKELYIIASSTTCYLVGIFFHFVSDVHKSIQLRYQTPRSLISDGLFKHTRNPNYFGEVMIYLGYAILSCHPVFVGGMFAIVWIFMFIPNMKRKDASLSRHSGWEKYKESSGFFFPWLPAMLPEVFVVESLLNRVPSSISSSSGKEK